MHNAKTVTERYVQQIQNNNILSLHFLQYANDNSNSVRSIIVHCHNTYSGLDLRCYKIQ